MKDFDVTFTWPSGSKLQLMSNGKTIEIALAKAIKHMKGLYKQNPHGYGPVWVCTNIEITQIGLKP